MMSNEKWESLKANDPRYARIPRNTVAPATGQNKISLPCISVGKAVRGAAAPDTIRDWRTCDYGHGVTCSCHCNDNQKCKDYDPSWEYPKEMKEEKEQFPNIFPLRLDGRNVGREVGGRRSNCSIIEWEDGYLFAYRVGWEGSEIYLQRLDSRFRSVGRSVKLDLYHPKAMAGREDPRLFVHNRRLHLAYVGVMVQPNWHTNILYAEISDDLKVVAKHYPYYTGRRDWEKNWSFFSHQGSLYAIYSINPHRILRINGDQAEFVCETNFLSEWSGGEMRGGASPVLHNGQYYHFFHASKTINGVKTYHTGLYTFEPEAPFRVKAVTPEPILWPDKATMPPNWHTSVVFAGGAMLLGDRWIVAHGYHDHWSTLDLFDAAELDRKLFPVLSTDDFEVRDGTDDRAIWKAVTQDDEYKLKRLDLTNATVIDIGAHIGTFARECKRRGAAIVHSYEPDPRNVELLERNVGSLEGVAIFPRPVWSHATKIGLVSKPDPSHNRTIADPRSEIESEPISRVIARAVAARDKHRGLLIFKIDCEGGELPIMPAALPYLDHVDVICGEWHGDLALATCEATLLAAGFPFETTDRKASGGLFFGQKMRRLGP